MPHGKDFIPQSDAGLAAFAEGFHKAALKYATLLGVPATVTGDLTEKKLEFESLVALCNLPEHSSLNITAKKSARIELVAALRHYKRAYLDKNPLVTPSILKEYGIEERDTVRTTIGTPKATPHLYVQPAGEARKLVVTFFDPAESSKKIPYGCDRRDVRFPNRRRAPGKSGGDEPNAGVFVPQGGAGVFGGAARAKDILRGALPLGNEGTRQLERY